MNNGYIESAFKLSLYISTMKLFYIVYMTLKILLLN